MPRKLLLLPPLSVSSAFRAPRACPAARPAMNAARNGYRVFSANSTAACTELAKRITERLGAELGKSVVYQETNGETRVEIQESVRGQDIFIIQTIPRDVNTAVMELLIMAYALKTACARNIIGVIPYFPYSKQSKMRKRGSIVCKLLASMLAKAGLTHIITMDLHQKEIQGFFSFPVDNLRQLGRGSDVAGHYRPGTVWTLPPVSPGSQGLEGGSSQALPSDMWTGGLPDGYSNSASGHALCVVPGSDQRCSLVPVPGAAPLSSPGNNASDLQLLLAKEENGNVSSSKL